MDSRVEEVTFRVTSLSLYHALDGSHQRNSEVACGKLLPTRAAAVWLPQH